MWYFRALAFDLDGTLARDDAVPEDLLQQLDAAREERRLVLVTGRTHHDLNRVFPGLTAHFDAVVTENGAVLHTAHGDRLLHEPIGSELRAALRHRSVAMSEGEVIIAIDGSDVGAAMEAISALGADEQILHNRGPAMILPAGVTKGTGLCAALSSLGLSAHNTVAVGDGENDLALLRSAEVGVAVTDAVPSLAAAADLLLEQPDGKGVQALLGGDLLAGHQRLCPPRRWVEVGDFVDGDQVRLPGSQSSILIAGESGSGKSYLAGLLAERWVDEGYSVLLLDPEGDHLGLAERPGVQLVDARTMPPAPQLLRLLEPGRTSVLLDLSTINPDERAKCLRELPDAVEAHRAQYGVPHWILYDEAQDDVLPDRHRRMLSEPGSCLVTWRPDLLPGDVVGDVEFTIDVERCAEGAAHYATLTAGGTSRRFQIGARSAAHVRHWHKYCTTPLPLEQRFRFHNPQLPTAQVEAATVAEFDQEVGRCDSETLAYHLERQDFSTWCAGALSDDALAREFLAVERDVARRRAASLEEARDQIHRAIELRYGDGLVQPEKEQSAARQ